jgi:hypothetical protein
MDLYEELRNLIDVLTKAGLDYALCGGIAVAFHGYPRFTKDIDILIRSEDVDRVLDAVRACDFVFVAEPMTFGSGGPNEQVILRVSKIEGQDLLTLDLLILNPMLQDVWDERGVFQWNTRQIQVVAVEGLAKMKRLAGRDQDLLDLKMLGFAAEGESADEQDETR